MPHIDRRAAVIAKKGKYSTAGRMQVTYRDAKGFTKAARVLGQGTASGLKLSIGSNGNAILDNVPMATSKTSTNAYFSR